MRVNRHFVSELVFTVLWTLLSSRAGCLQWNKSGLTFWRCFHDVCMCTRTEWWDGGQVVSLKTLLLSFYFIRGGQKKKGGRRGVNWGGGVVFFSLSQSFSFAFFCLVLHWGTLTGVLLYRALQSVLITAWFIQINGAIFNLDSQNADLFTCRMFCLAILLGRLLSSSGIMKKLTGATQWKKVDAKQQTKKKSKTPEQSWSWKAFLLFR